jgi:hypothetical protein
MDFQLPTCKFHATKAESETKIGRMQRVDVLKVAREQTYQINYAWRSMGAFTTNCYPCLDDQKTSMLLSTSPVEFETSRQPSRRFYVNSRQIGSHIRA